MRGFWLIIFYLLVSGQSFASAKTIIFNMSENGYPPFMINNKPPSGIIYDVLQIILAKHGYDIKTAKIPKNRELGFLRSGKLDAQAIAKEWVEEPNKYEFSDPILKVRNVIISSVDNPVIFTKIEDLIGKKSVTHLGYKYPPLTRYFKNGLIERNDTVNETAMLAMIQSQRADFTIVNDYVGAWIIQKQNWSGQFVISKKDVTNYDYRIMFSKKWKLLVSEFNKELAILKENGTFEKIVQKYVGTSIKSK